MAKKTVSSSVARTSTLDSLSKIFKLIGHEWPTITSPLRPLTPKVLDTSPYLFFIELSLDTNYAFFPQGSPTKSTCIVNADDAAVVMDLTETTDPLSSQRQDEFQNMSIEGNQDPDTHHIQVPLTTNGGETHSTDNGKSNPPTSEKSDPCGRQKFQ